MKVIARIAVCGLAVSSFALATAQEVDHEGRDIRVGQEGRMFPFGRDTRPFWTEGRALMVPLRDLAEKIHAKVGRNRSGRIDWIELGDRHIETIQGREVIKVGDRDVDLHAAPIDKRGILYVPVQVFVILTHGRVNFDREGWRVREGWKPLEREGWRMEHEHDRD